MTGWNRFSKWVVAVSLVSGAAWAGTPAKSGESCLKSDGATGCDNGICDVTGAVPGSSCSATSPQTCSCITGVTCLTDAQCTTGSFCNAQYECEANSDGSGADSGTGFGCSSTGASLAALIPLAGLLRRRRGHSVKA